MEFIHIDYLRWICFKSGKAKKYGFNYAESCCMEWKYFTVNGLPDRHWKKRLQFRKRLTRRSKTRLRAAYHAARNIGKSKRDSELFAVYVLDQLVQHDAMWNDLDEVVRRTKWRFKKNPIHEAARQNVLKIMGGSFE